MFSSELQYALKYVRGKISSKPKIAIILGSGLGPFADELSDKIVISTSSIPNYPVSTVEGHAGKWIMGEFKGKPVLALKGRVHSYEGYSLQKVTFGIHLLAEFGIQTMIVTNAAGGLNRSFAAGDLMLITDHINLMFDNPLFGPNDNSLGPRFPDMCAPYSVKLQKLAENTALELGIKLQKGVLASLKGPTYETAAEVRMMQNLCADAGTMSTVPEVITAVYRGLRVLGISCITNLGTGMTPNKLSHEEVTEVAEHVKDKFFRLIKEIITRL